MKRILAVLALIVTFVAIGASAAFATAGSSLGTGQISVQNVWVSETHTFPGNSNTTETLDVDCPSGEHVITGFGIWVILADGSTSSVSGSALDSDTWRVSFNYQGSQPLSSTLQAHATCN